MCSCVFFFNDTATTEIYTLSLHDALPISSSDDLRPLIKSTGMYAVRWSSFRRRQSSSPPTFGITTSLITMSGSNERARSDRKSTRLNSSHANISYAVFCLKKKKISDVHYP